MNKTIGNFLAQQNNGFPLDCETLDYLQTNQHIAEMLGAIAGDKIILSGCSVSGSNRTDGYIFLKTVDFPQGEVLYFEGGESVHSTIYLAKSAISVTANADPYANAYTQRMLKAGLGAEQYDWSDFVTLTDKTNRQLLSEINTLRAQIASLQPAPTGSIMMWAKDAAPSGWHLCDGARFNIPSSSSDEMYAIYQVIGTSFKLSTDGEGTFRLPDMQGLYVAGKGANGYNSINQKGGFNTVALAMEEMPKHNHNTSSSVSDGSVITNTTGKHKHAVDSFLGNDSAGWRNNFEYGTCNKNTLQVTPPNSDMVVLTENGEHAHSVAMKARGGQTNGSTKAHENRPPFIVLNYIIKIL